MKYAVVRTGGKQYKIAEGDVIEVEKINEEKDFIFDKVLLYTADGVIKVGTPLVEGVTVKASVISQVKGEKIRVSKYKAKVRYRRVTGHRQQLTQVKIESIAGKGEEKILKAAKETKNAASTAKVKEDVVKKA